jgi:polar amino acid transport system substrate-binding protein
MSRLHLHHLGALAGALSALLLAGCGEEPTPPRLISFTPAVLSVQAEQTLGVGVEYEENDFALDDFQWRAAAGAIEGNGAPSIIYHAPEQPGDYRISVSVRYGDAATPLSLESTIEVTEAVGGAAPAVAEAPAPKTSPGEPAAAADRPAPAPLETTASTERAAGGAVEAGRAAAEHGTERTAGEGAAVSGEAGKATSEDAAGMPAAPGQAVEDAATAAGQETEPAPTAAAQGAGQPEESGAATAQATATAPGPAMAEAPAAGETAEPAGSAIAPVTAEAGGREAAPAPGAPEAGVTAPEAAAAESATQVAARAAPDAAAAAGSRVDRILDRRRLSAVVQIAFKPFSFYGEDGARTGFDIDFLREFARRWLDDPDALTYLPVPADERVPMLLKGRADLIAAALTRTPERAREVDFSLTYFKDAQRLLVPATSEVAGVCDLEGKKVAAVEGSTSLVNIQVEARKCGFELGDRLVVFRRHDDAAQALLEGRVDAFTSDAMALRAYAAGQPLKVVGEAFSEEPYGLAVAKGDARLLELINRTLREMEQDGTYAAIYTKWFGDAIRPYPLGAPDAPVADATLAEATPGPAAIEPGAGASGTVETYVVRPGDTLSRIARKHYGAAWATSWQRIYEANRDVIGPDPGRLEVGMKLEIPK